jgi:hypothetical protein
MSHGSVARRTDVISIHGGEKEKKRETKERKRKKERLDRYGKKRDRKGKTRKVQEFTGGQGSPSGSAGTMVLPYKPG